METILAVKPNINTRERTKGRKNRSFSVLGRIITTLSLWLLQTIDKSAASGWHIQKTRIKSDPIKLGIQSCGMKLIEGKDYLLCHSKTPEAPAPPSETGLISQMTFLEISTTKIINIKMIDSIPTGNPPILQNKCEGMTVMKERANLDFILWNCEEFDPLAAVVPTPQLYDKFFTYDTTTEELSFLGRMNPLDQEIFGTVEIVPLTSTYLIAPNGKAISDNIPAAQEIVLIDLESLSNIAADGDLLDSANYIIHKYPIKMRFSTDILIPKGGLIVLDPGHFVAVGRSNLANNLCKYKFSGLENYPMDVDLSTVEIKYESCLTAILDIGDTDTMIIKSATFSADTIGIYNSKSQKFMVWEVFRSRITKEFLISEVQDFENMNGASFWVLLNTTHFTSVSFHENWDEEDDSFFKETYTGTAPSNLMVLPSSKDLLLITNQRVDLDSNYTIAIVPLTKKVCNKLDCLLCTNLEACSFCSKGFLKTSANEEYNENCTSQCELKTSYECKQASSNCNMPGSRVQECVSCKGESNYSFNGFCTENCPDKHQKISGECINMFFGVKEETQICLTFDTEKNECSSCHHGAFREDGQPTCSLTCGGIVKERTNFCVTECLHLGCKTCGNSRWECSECEDGYSLFNNHCLKSCPHGYGTKVGANKLCQGTCNYPCNTCTDVETCTSCIEGFFLKDGGCVVDCENSVGIIKPSSGDCSTSCKTGCKTCLFEIWNCLSCNENRRQMGNSCLLTCKFDQYEDDNSANPRCIDCNQDITQCNSCFLDSQDNVQCENCLQGYFLKNNECVIQCALDEVYSPSDGKCQNCKGDCLTCYQSPFFCTSCSPGLYLSENKCVSQCPNGMTESPKSGICEECSSRCLTKGCRLSPEQCYYCKDQYTRLLEDWTCLNTCPPDYTTETGLKQCNHCEEGCSSCTDSKTECTSCRVGYYSYNNWCIKTCPSTEILFPATHQCGTNCDDNCQTCFSTGDHCLSCKSSFYLEDRKCVLSCANGTVGVGKRCYQCQEGCQICVDSPNNCTTCQANKYRSENGCFDYCPKGFTRKPADMVCKDCSTITSDCNSCDTTGQCLGCTAPKVLENEVCVDQCTTGIQTPDSGICGDCSEECDECEIYLGRCTSCKTGTFLHINKCLPQCPGGYTLKPLNSECELCDLGCKVCLSSSTDCLYCPDDKLLVAQDNNSGEKTCVDTCPQEVGTPMTSDPETKLCELCSDLCLTCVTSKAICTSCKPGAFMFEDYCWSNCPVNYTESPIDGICVPCTPPCVRCENEPGLCLSCTTPEYLDGTSCSPCGAGQTSLPSNGICQDCISCTECTTSPIDCTACDTGQALIDDLCRLSCTLKDTEVAPSNSQCVGCDPSCKECGATTAGCIICEENYFLTAAGVCQLSCPSGVQNPENGVCEACSAQCKTCEGIPSNCLECEDNYLKQGETCVSQCSAGLALGEDDKCSKRCKGCLICDKDNENTCYTCPEGTFLYQSECLDECPIGYTESEIEKVCQPCHPNCASCYFTDAVCLTCLPGKYFNEGQCLDKCPLGKIESSEDFVCKFCIANCKACGTKIDECLSCLDGFYFDETTDSCNKYPVCPEGTVTYPENGRCEECDSICSGCLGTPSKCIVCTGMILGDRCLEQCPGGYTFDPTNDKSKCEACSDGCDICRGDKDSCEKCADNYLMTEDGTCQSACLPHETQTPNTRGLCQRCQEGCLTCQDFPYFCTSCLPKWVLYQNRCYEEVCPEGTVKTPKTENCVACSPDCLTCSVEELECLICQSDKYLNNGECVDTCPTGTIAEGRECVPCDPNCKNGCQNTSYECIECETGSWSSEEDRCVADCLYGKIKDESSDSCIECGGSNCKVCNEEDVCLKCETNFYLNPLTNQCTNACPSGYIGNISLRKCDPCPQDCSTCSDSNTCTACKADTFEHGVNCLKECPDGTYKEDSTSTCEDCSSNCLLCRNQSTECTDCQDNLYLNVDIDNTCVSECSIGTYLTQDNKRCERCGSNCLECQDSTVCEKTADTFKLWESQSLVECPLGMTRDPSTTPQVCLDCEVGCTTCKGTPSNCLTCEDGKKLFENQCLDECPAKMTQSPLIGICEFCREGCQSCLGENFVCTGCETGLYLDEDSKTCMEVCPSGKVETPSNSKCELCNSKCTQCEGNPDNCTRCNQVLVLNGNICQDSCPSGKTQNPLNLNCENCEGCETCQNYKEFCTKCRPGKYLYKNKCYTQCPDGFYKDDSESIHKCSPCHNNCRLCDGGSTNSCLACYKIGLTFYRELSKECYEECPQGAFENEEKVCQECHESCSSCTGPNSNQCLSCNQGNGDTAQNYLLNGICQENCPSKMFKDDKLNPNIYQCSFCHPNCRECTSNLPSACTACRQDTPLKYFLTGSCYHTCPKGYFYNQAEESELTCGQCNKKCLSCSENGDKCDACDIGLILENNDCRLDCGPKKAWTALNTCTDCSQNCEWCESVTLKCLTASEGYEINVDDPRESMVLPLKPLILIDSYYTKKNRKAFFIFNKKIKNKKFEELLIIQVVDKGTPNNLKLTRENGGLDYIIKRTTSKLGIEIQLDYKRSIERGRLILENTNSRHFEADEPMVTLEANNRRRVLTEVPTYSFIQETIELDNLTYYENQRMLRLVDLLKKILSILVPTASIFSLIFVPFSGIMLIRRIQLINLLKFVNVSPPRALNEFLKGFSVGIWDLAAKFDNPFTKFVEKQDGHLCSSQQIQQKLEENGMSCYVLGSVGHLVLILGFLALLKGLLVIGSCITKNKKTTLTKEKRLEIKSKTKKEEPKSPKKSLCEKMSTLMNLEFWVKVFLTMNLEFLVPSLANMMTFTIQGSVFEITNSVLSLTILFFSFFMTVWLFKKSNQLENYKTRDGLYWLFSSQKPRREESSTSTEKQMQESWLFLKKEIKQKAKRVGSLANEFKLIGDLMFSFFVMTYLNYPYQQIFPLLVIVISLFFFISYRLPYKKTSRNILSMIFSAIIFFSITTLFLMFTFDSKLSMKEQAEYLGLPIIIGLALLVFSNILFAYVEGFIQIAHSIQNCRSKKRQGTSTKRTERSRKEK